MHTETYVNWSGTQHTYISKQGASTQLHSPRTVGAVRGLARAVRRQRRVQDEDRALRAGLGAVWVDLPRRRRDRSRDGRRGGWTRRTGTARGRRSATGSERNIVRQAF